MLDQNKDSVALDRMVDEAYHILFDDMSVPLDQEKLDYAVNCLKTAIKAGHTVAMLNYGAIFYNGRGVEQDFNQAIHWYREAARRGNPRAINNMGYQYYYGRGDLEVDMEMAYRCFSKAAMLGVSNSMYKCGDMFLEGLYVEKDPDTAFQLYMKCYAMTRKDQPIDCYPDVCRRIGTCFHRGIGTERDLLKARKYLAKAILGFQRRIKEGDPFTSGVMDQAIRELREVCVELRDE